ncbi:MAG: hypothetical protein IKI23_11875 [Lachnospiraceae bacterium]|nr:hypothetical protein [Lachnospiraceae bacterium]
MYLKSRQLSERIRAVTEEAERLTDHVCAFEEFIALPFFGQIILRFNLNKDEFTAEEVWRFESILRMAAGEEFLTDFMGSVYRKAGLDFSLLEIRLRELDRQLRDESVPSSLHAEGIRSDGPSCQGPQAWIRTFLYGKSGRKETSFIFCCRERSRSRSKRWRNHSEYRYRKWKRGPAQV